MTETTTTDEMPQAPTLLATETRPTFREQLRSITGWERQAIQRAFNMRLSEMDEVDTATAAVFIKLRREGQDDVNAYNSAMGMPLGDIDDAFTPEPKEGDSGPGKA